MLEIQIYIFFSVSCIHMLIFTFLADVQKLDPRIAAKKENGVF